jgi:MFS family permease
MDARAINRSVMLSMALFFLQPMIIGAWLALIPYVKTTLGLSKAELALALLGMPSALLITLQFVGRIIGAFGLRRLFLYAFPAQGLAAFLPLFAGGQGTLFLSLAVFGVAVAFMEVALNVYAGRVEKAVGAHIMNRCHGFWAMGLMGGSLLATSVATMATPIAAMLLVSAVSTAAGLVAARRLPKVGEAEATRNLPRRALRNLPNALLPIGAFMFAVTLTEGAMGDWAAVYLSERLASAVTEAGIAVTIFSGFMAAGRFSGDALKRRFGAVALARGSALFAIAGLLCLVLPLPLGFAFAGFALVGLGVAAGYPLGVSAVAALDDTYEAANVALMSTCALTGFLIRPPLIGFLSEAFGLRVGFAALIPGLLLCAGLAAWLRPVGQAAGQGDSGA